MRGKLGIVIGLAAGYVIGARAGRERYDQIKTQWLKVYEAKPVQKQLDNVKQMGKDAASAVPSALWSGAVKATKAATGSGTPKERLDAVGREARRTGDDLSTVAKKTGDQASDAAGEAAEDIKKAAQKNADQAADTVDEAAGDTNGAADKDNGN